MQYPVLGVILLALVAHASAQTCCAPIDLVYVVDESGSIDYTEFGLMKNFIYNLTSTFCIPDVHVAMVQFASSASIKWPFTAYLTKPDLLTAITGMVKGGGGTSIGAGLIKAIELYEGATARAGVSKIVIVFSDGYSSTYNLTLATDYLKNTLGAVVGTVAVGNGVNYAQMQSIASTGYAFNVTSFTTFNTILQPLLTTVCPTTTDSPNSSSDHSHGQGHSQGHSHGQGHNPGHSHGHSHGHSKSGRRRRSVPAHHNVHARAVFDTE